MPIKLKIELLLAILLFLYIIYRAIKKKRLTVKYSVIWMFMVIILGFFAIFSDPIIAFANLLGIQTGSNMIFLIVIGLLIFLCFSLTIIISSHKQRIINLTQEFGILRRELINEKNKKHNK